MTESSYDNYENPSSALKAMKATLSAIQKVRELLESEEHNLSEDAYKSIKEHLSSIEYGLTKEIGEIEAQKHMEAPHLYDDDDDDYVNEDAKKLWNSLLALVNLK